jgi:hypothetical protein
MPLDLPLSPAFLNLEPWSIAIIVPVAGLIFAGALVITTMYFQNRRREMWHQTARLALEKGQPLPAFPDDEGTPRPRSTDGSAANDLRAGLICIGCGFGLYFFLGALVDRSLGYVGAIPGFVGVALLISGACRLLFARKETPDNGRSPQP